MADRPIRTITTAGGHKVVLNAYITGREQREIQEVFLRGVDLGKLAQGAGKPADVSGFSASSVSEAQDLTLKLLIVSFDDALDNLVNKVLDLPALEFEEVMAAVNEITETKKK